jgi:hypothetical protein
MKKLNRFSLNPESGTTHTPLHRLRERGSGNLGHSQRHGISGDFRDSDHSKPDLCRSS